MTAACCRRDDRPFDPIIIAGMPDDPRQIVTSGYDAAADQFDQWITSSVVDPARERYRALFSALLPRGSSVLELGCGGGGPTTAEFARRFSLTGLDISSTQVALARERIPLATFLRADMTRFAPPPSSFDGVAAFYSLIHLPYGELPTMLLRIATWLQVGGAFVASLGARGAGEHVEPEWLGGAPMYWSGYALDEYRRFLADAGLAVVEASVEQTIEDGEESPFFWVVARKAAQSR